jgi:hypothetical protein
MMITEEWIKNHRASTSQIVPLGGTAIVDSTARVKGLMDKMAPTFALEHYGCAVPLRVGARGLHPDDAAAFLRAIDAGLVVVEPNGSFQSKACRPKKGGGRYSLFTANRLNDDFYISLNTEYLIHFGAATELVTTWGWNSDQVEVEVGEFDARAWKNDKVQVAMEAKARVEGQDGLAPLLSSFLNFAKMSDPPQAVDNHSRKYVELLRLAEDGPLHLWLVAAGARWTFVAERVGNHIELSETDGPLTSKNFSVEPAQPTVHTKPLQLSPCVDHAAARAKLTELDTRQRVYEFPWADEVSVREFINLLNPELINNGLVHTRPWVWFASSSGGRPLSPLGKDTGLELRLSYSVKPRKHL